MHSRHTWIDCLRLASVSDVPVRVTQRVPRIKGIDGDAHDAVHNVPLARLVFVPENDGRLHRCAIDAIEAGHNAAGGGKEAERKNDGPPHDGCSDISIPGSDGQGVAA